MSESGVGHGVGCGDSVGTGYRDAGTLTTLRPERGGARARAPARASCSLYESSSSLNAEHDSASRLTHKLHIYDYMNICALLCTLVCLPGRRCVLCLPGVFVFAVEQRAARTTGTCVRDVL